MAKPDDRVLSFFVSGALLAGSAACTKNQNEAAPRANTADHEEHVNEGPMNEGTPTNTTDTKPAEGIPKEVVAPDTDLKSRKHHVNTRHFKDKSTPPPVPEAAQVPRTNTGRQDESPLQASPPDVPVEDDTNTGRQEEAIKPAVPERPKEHKTNTGRHTNRAPKSAPIPQTDSKVNKIDPN